MRPSKLLTIAASLAVLPMLALAGCGGGGDDSTESTATAAEAAPALSKAELISQGDAICGEVNAAIGSLAASEATDQNVKTADLYIGMVESIRRLGAPEETEGYAEFIAAAEELSAVEAEIKLASERGDTAALGEATTRAAPLIEAFGSAAGEYGFKECSEGPSAPAPTGAGSGVTPPAEEEGGIEVAPEELEEEAPIEEVVPEEVAPETGGAGGGIEEAAPESGGSGGGSSGGVGPG